MKTLKELVMALSHWLLVDPRSEKFFNWILITASGLFFGNLVIQFLIKNL